MPTVSYLHSKAIHGIDKPLGHYITWKTSGSRITQEKLEDLCTMWGFSKRLCRRPPPSVRCGRAVSAFRRELKYREGLEVVKQGITLLVYRAVPSGIKTEDRQHIITMYLRRYPTIPSHVEHVPINMADPTSITSDYASLFDRCVEDAEKYATASDFSRLIVNALDDDRGAMRLDPNSSKLWFKTEDQAFMDRLQGICKESGMATVRFLPVADTTEARKTVADSFKDTIANHIAEITEATDAWDGTDPSKAVQYLRKFKEVKMKLASAGDFYAENVDKLNNIIDLATKEVQRKAASSST